MAIIKEAFCGKKHISIAKFIMGSEYEDRFDEINGLMDGKGGRGHRYKHGHDKGMEKKVLEKYGEKGRRVFRIHVLADRYQDKAEEVVKQQLEEVEAGKEPVPYYEESYERVFLYPDEENSVEVTKTQPEKVSIFSELGRRVVLSLIGDELLKEFKTTLEALNVDNLFIFQMVSRKNDAEVTKLLNQIHEKLVGFVYEQKINPLWILGDDADSMFAVEGMLFMTLLDDYTISKKDVAKSKYKLHG